VPPSAQAAAPPAAPPAASEARDDAAAPGSIAETSIRVDVGLLDKLMNLVGELVLARNQILQFTSRTEGTALTATSQRLNLITTELQGGVMKTRMQPIGNVWSKFPRVVRDLASACHKQVQIEMVGQETELDKTIIEAIKDPLTHVVRNSVDHGLETAEARIAAGKPPTGSLVLRAFHEGGQVNIEISDDGRGIDVERVKQKALQSGAVTHDAVERMSERELINLIFLPGLSTAEKLSNISGRGVGMDVVRTNIEKIGGTVDLHSQLGKGTTIKIKIPLTLAIIPALIVMSGGDRYAIPQVNLLELVRLEEDQAGTAIELIHDAPVYRLRGNLLPLIYLSKLFRQTDKAPAGGAVNIVVLQAGEQQFGLVVAAINDTEEIVVKPLAKQLKSIPTFAGATIMGDGKVALILDVVGIAQHAGLMSDSRDRRRLKQAADIQEQEASRQSFLLCGVGENGRMAIPLSAVDRLEEFPRLNTEQTGTRRVIQYRDRILPLLWLDQLIPGETRVDGDKLPDSYPVIVFQDGMRRVGLVVDRILDIVEDNPVLEHPSTRPGILGCAVIQGRVTEVLDVYQAVNAIDPTVMAAGAGQS
jgi:two-component system chemotaxis sensor kinase CheA